MSQEKKTTLEEAARLYAIPHYMKDIDVNYIEEYPYDPGLEAAFIAGAEWQKEQMPMPEDTVIFQKGIEEGKRQGREEMFEELRKISATGVVICECSAPEKQQKED